MWGGPTPRNGVAEFGSQYRMEPIIVMGPIGEGKLTLARPLSE